MTDQHPSADDVKVLRDAIHLAWAEVPEPNWSDFIVDDLDSRDSRRYFFHRQVQDVDLFNSQASQQQPLIYFRASASLYYLKAYLLYMVDIEKHVTGGGEYWCGDMPSVHLITYLCRGRPAQPYPSFSIQQVQCIISLLELVARFSSFYCCESGEDLSYLAGGIIKWNDIMDVLKGGMKRGRI